MNEVQRLAEAEEQNITCKSCGATIPISSKFCSFCGSVNEIGDELDYQEKLKNLKENLEDLENVTEDSYKEEVVKNVRNIGRIAIIIGALFVVIAIIVAIIFYVHQKRKTVALRDEIVWQKETYARLDEMYENGDYDAICDFYNDFYMSNDYGRYSLGAWEHNTFLDVYTLYKELIRSVEFCEKYPENKDEEKNYAFNCIVSLVLTDWEKADYAKQLTGKDKSLIEEYRKYAYSVLENNFHMTEAELESIKEEMFEDNYSFTYPDHRKVMEYAEKLDWYED